MDVVFIGALVAFLLAAYGFAAVCEQLGERK